MIKNGVIEVNAGMGAFLDKPKTDKENSQGVAHVSLALHLELSSKFDLLDRFRCSLRY